MTHDPAPCDAAPSLQATEAVAATELAACPFCGAQPRTHHYAGEFGFFAIECPNCNGASEDGTDRFVGVHGDKAEAIVAWNTRASASTIATLRKALEDVREIASDSDTRGWLDFDRIFDIASAALDEKGE